MSLISSCCIFSGAVVVSDGSLGRGLGDIFSYDCHGNESSLLDCVFSGHGNYNHNSDYGVVCGCCMSSCNPDPTRETCIPVTMSLLTTQYVETSSAAPTMSTTQDPEMSTGTNEPLDSFTTRMIINTEQTEREVTTSGEMVNTQAMVIGNCGSSNALGALVGILVFVLMVVIIGWIVSVIVLRRKIKESYRHKHHMRCAYKVVV